LQPELDLTEIASRMDAVGELRQKLIEREEIKALFKRVHDGERLLSKVSLSTANGRAMIALGNYFHQPLAIKKQLLGFSSRRLCELETLCDPLVDVVASVEKALQENPPIQITEGGLIRDGYHSELDELRRISTSGKQFVAEIESRERARTGINSLK